MFLPPKREKDVAGLIKKYIFLIPAPPIFSIRRDAATGVNPAVPLVEIPERRPPLTTVGGYRNPVSVPFLSKMWYKYMAKVIILFETAMRNCRLYFPVLPPFCYNLLIINILTMDIK